MQTTESIIDLATFRDEGAVRRFLGDHPELVPTVEIAGRLIRKVFGRDSSGIELWVNEGDEYQPPYLTIGIQTVLRARAAVNRLHDLHKEWFQATEPRAREQILVTLVPV